MNNLYEDSWEEKAFAEDAARALGGYVWPPRSYSCTFCRREFRSAQALGGHMNVHRRDRARMRQSPIPDLQTEVTGAQIHVSNCCLSFDPPRYSSQMSTTCLLRVSDDSQSWVSPPSNVTRVSSSSDAKFSCGEKRSMIAPSESRAEKEDCVIKDLSTSLSFVVCQQNASSEEEVGSCKRRRVNEANPLCFFPKLGEVDHTRLAQLEVLKHFGSAEEVQLDLELRLGDVPKVR